MTGDEAATSAVGESVGSLISPPLPLPADMEGKKDPQLDEAVKAQNLRANVGYLLGLASLLAAAAIIIYSFCSLSKLHLQQATEPGSTDSISVHVFYVQVGGHVLITVAAIWFLYQLLRAAERLALPRAWAQNPEVARAMLGINSPLNEVSGLLTQLITLAKKIPGAGE